MSRKFSFGTRSIANWTRPLWAIAIVAVMLASSAVASAESTSAHPATATPGAAGGGLSFVLNKQNIAFTGDVQSDFAGDLLYSNSNTSLWSDTNNITGVYAAYNSTQLFLGLNATADGNSVMFFLSNETSSPLGTTNITGLTAWSGRAVNFTSPINYAAIVYSSGLNTGPSGQTAVRITSDLSASNTASVTSVAIANTWGFGPSGYEVAINWSGLFPSGLPNSTIGLHLSACVVGGGGAWVGICAPFLQQGAYNDGSGEPYFLINNTFTIVAPQVTTHTFILNDQNVAFTGNVQSDFAGDLLYTNVNTTQWGAGNNITGVYAAYNATELFLGLNATAEGNSAMFFLANETYSGLGSTNQTGLSGAYSGSGTQDINFTTPINYEADALSSSGAAPNTGVEDETAVRVSSPISASNTSSETYLPVTNTWATGPSGYEVALAWSSLYPTGFDGPAGLLLSALIAGGGAWVGMGAPYSQIGQYNAGGSQPYFLINNTFSILAPSVLVTPPGPVYPINLNIIFNDHQPFYQSISSTSDYLPWTVVHLEEYAEQAIIAGEAPTINVTYSLSGSLLYQIEAIADGQYNNSYLQTAYIPTSQWGNSVWTEISEYGDTFLESLIGSADWNSTNVSQAIEFDLAFNTPLWVYSAGTPAANLYNTLFNIEQSQISSQTTMNVTDLTDALVEFFLWSASYPIISGQLGSTYMNTTMLPFYSDSSFSISDLKTISGYYPAEATLTLAAFLADRLLNNNSAGNVELLTTAFDHPILPLLLLNNWTGESGDSIVKGVWANDTIAQLNIGRDLYDRIFGQYPTGLWSSEQAVSQAVVQYINSTGYTWTSSSEGTLAETGIATPQDVATPTALEEENLYTPYRVTGPGGTSTVMVFRDDDLSNAWGFNYGGVAESGGSWAAVSDFMSYLQGVATTIPESAHNATLVTVALDGENWMFESPFPEDAVPFLQDLYTSLAQNSSWVHTTTVQQYLATDPTLPTISNLAIGSWNAEPAGPGISQYLGQWAGHGPQDSTWQQLTLVRSEVAAYGTANSLVQPTNESELTAYNNFPVLSGWNATTAQGKYDEAWMAIYLAEGSDITFTFDPGDESLTSQNAVVFENEFRADLSQALEVLGLPLTPFLSASYVPPVSPTVWGTNASVSPVLTGSLYTTGTYSGGTAYSVNDNIAWNGAYEEETGSTTQTAGAIGTVYYAFDANNLYFSVKVNGPTSEYIAPNFYTAAPEALDIFFSPANPGAGDLESLAIPDAAYTVGTTPFGFAATSEITIEGSSVTSSGSATMALYHSSGSGTWTYNTSVAGDAFVGEYLQLEVPLTALGMVPGDSVEFLVAAVNATTGNPSSSVGPLIETVPASLATLTLISTIHNTAPSDGPGTYTYPTEAVAGVPDYPPNSVDMQWVNVSDNPYTVQFNITFGNLSNVFGGGDGFTQPIIDIYIHEPGVTGSTSGLPGVNINVSASSAWAWVIQASGYSSNNYVESASGVSIPTAVLVSTNLPTAAIAPERTVSIEVPTSLIGNAISSYNYTIVAGFQDGYATNGWDTVNIGAAGAYQGGGATSSAAPTVFSYIAPAVVGGNPSLTQEALLSTYTSTTYATLDAISLPLLSTSTTQVATLGASAIVGTSSDPDAYYAFGSQIYNSTSTDGTDWTTPTPLVNLSFVPNGLAATGGSESGLVAWNGSSYVFENLASDSFSNGTASGTIEAGAVTYADGSFLLALDVAGTVSVGPPGAAAWGTDALGAVAVALSTDSVGTYLAYATASALDVVSLTLGTASVTFGSSSEMTVALPTGATAESLSLGAAPNGGFALAVAMKNASGSNIYLASGIGTQTLKTLTTDGADSSPSVLIVNASGTYDAYVGFTSSAGSGNVFYFPTPVATVTPTTTTTPPPPTSSPSTPLWVWIAIAVVVILVVVGVVVVLLRRPKQPSSATSPASDASKPMDPAGGSDSMANEPPSGGDSS